MNFLEFRQQKPQATPWKEASLVGGFLMSKAVEMSQVILGCFPIADMSA